MNDFEKNQDRNYRRGGESREVGIESKEKQESQEAKKAAAREKAEAVGKEVKNTKQQIQNIIANMQMVIAAVRKIRAQLGVGNGSSIPSLVGDEVALKALREKLSKLIGQVSDLRTALIQEEERAVQEEAQFAGPAEIKAEAQRRADGLLEQLGLGKEEPV